MDADDLAGLLASYAVLATFAFAFARYPMVVFSLAIIWISFVWRTISIAYLDIAGPLYAYQIYRSVGGEGYSLVFATACLLIVLPFFYFLGDRGSMYFSQLADISGEMGRTAQARRSWNVADLATVMVSFLVIGLYASILAQGNIPLLSGVEQANFKGEYATFLHNLFMPVQMIFAFTLGSIFAHHHIRTGELHLGILAMCVLLIGYAALTGHRFSFFFSFSSMFVAPLAVSIGVRSHLSGRMQRPFAWLTASFSRGQLVLATVAFVGLVGLMAVALANSYFNLRFAVADEARFALLQRVLVQPTELTWASLERVLSGAAMDRWSVLDFLFANPIDPNRNTTPQYLMLTYVGSDVTFYHLAAGVQFAGGFPEIIFEALGPVWAWPVIALIGWITAGIVFLVLRAVVLGHFATVFFGTYVLFGLLVMYIGGMVNFAMQATYFAKFALFLIAFTLENLALSRGTRLIPWHLSEWREIPARLIVTFGLAHGAPASRET